MRFSPTFPRHMLAIALLALAPAAGIAAPTQQPIIVAEAGDDDGDDDDAPRRRGMADEPETPDAGVQPARTGGSYGLDAFDANETPGLAGVNPGGVVCMAGCDGPSGALVYKTPTSHEKSSE